MLDACRTYASMFLIFCRVLNTDNMSVVGVTIDYGPFGFMDKYDPDFICNASGQYQRLTMYNYVIGGSYMYM